MVELGGRRSKRVVVRSLVSRLKSSGPSEDFRHETEDGEETGDETAIGRISQLSILSIEVWVAGLKVRRDSRSSPKNSARTGNSSPGDQMSTIPPRTE